MLEQVTRPALRWTRNPYGNTHRTDVTPTAGVKVALYIRPTYDLKREFGYMDGPHIGYRWKVYQIDRNGCATLLHSEVVNDPTETGLNEAKVKAEAYICTTNH